MLARELMTMPVVTLKPSWSVRRAIGVLHRHDITAAPVVDDVGRMIGIVSEMDLLRDAFAADPRAMLRASVPEAAPAPRTVEEVMTGRVLSMPENADVSDVVDLMMSTGVKSVPITRGNRLAGIVSRRDLLGVLAHSDRRIAADVRRALGDEYADEPAWHVRVRDGVAYLSGPADDANARIARILTETVPGVRSVEITIEPAPAGHQR